MQKIRACCVVIALMTLCGSVPSPTIPPAPETVSPATAMVTGTINPVLSPTLTSMPATMAPTLPATSGQSQAAYQPFSAILARMYPGPYLLLGGTENGEWLNLETVVPHLYNGQEYQTFSADGPTGSTKGKLPGYEQNCQGYQIETDSYPMGGRAVAVSGEWDVMPRLAQEISTDNAVYVEAIRNWLVGQSIPEPVVEISQILRVDIEGDGSEEVLISASHFVEPTGHSVEFGDYSLVLMRKVVGNSVVTVPIVADYYYQEIEIQFPMTYSGLFVADLNHNDILELVVGVERWEGNGVVVYEVEGTNVRMVLRIFCGL